MITILEKNLEALGRHDPELAELLRSVNFPSGAVILPTPSGMPTLVIDGLSLHGRIDPLTEARTWILGAQTQATLGNHRAVTVLGLGLGYHILVLAELGLEIQVVEPDAAIIRLAFSQLDFSTIMDRLTFSTNPDPAAIDPQRPVLIHGPSARRYPLHQAVWRTRADRIKRIESVSDRPDPNPIREWDLSPNQIPARSGPIGKTEAYLLLLEELKRA